jgi:hypothetical protein
MAEAEPANGKRGFWRLAVTLSGWLVAALVWVLDAPAKVNSFFTEGPEAVKNVSDALLLDKRLSGTWGLQEGIIDLDEAEQSRLSTARTAVTSSSSSQRISWR